MSEEKGKSVAGPDDEPVRESETIPIMARFTIEFDAHGRVREVPDGSDAFSFLLPPQTGDAIRELLKSGAAVAVVIVKDGRKKDG